MAGRTPAARAAACLLMCLSVLLTALPPACLSAAELADLEVLDLWDYPENLAALVEDGSTVFFICDPGLKECREGAVFIESRAARIREAGLRPVMLLRGSGPDVRKAALEMDLDTPIYIDEEGGVIDALLDQEILPALLLASKEGTVVETVYGGGDSLAGNLERILARAAPEPPPPVVARPEEKEKKSETWKIIAGIAALAIIGVIIFAD